MTNQPTLPAIAARQTNSWAIAAFVLSLFAWQDLFAAIITLVFAIIALDEINRRGQAGRAMAQFARAFAILMIIVLCTGCPFWSTLLSVLAAAG